MSLQTRSRSHVTQATSGILGTPGAPTVSWKCTSGGKPESQEGAFGGDSSPTPSHSDGKGAHSPSRWKTDWVSSSWRWAGSRGGEGLLGRLANDCLSGLQMKGLPHLLCHYTRTPGCLSPGPARQEETPQLYKMLGHPMLISPTAPQPGSRVQEHIRSLGVHGGSALSPQALMWVQGRGR